MSVGAVLAFLYAAIIITSSVTGLAEPNSRKVQTIFHALSWIIIGVIATYCFLKTGFTIYCAFAIFLAPIAELFVRSLATELTVIKMHGADRGDIRTDIIMSIITLMIFAAMVLVTVKLDRIVAAS